jgi:hypothetical protein
MYFNKGYNDPLLDSVRSVTEKVKYPHPMFNPKNGEEVVVRSEEEHNKYAEKGWVHEKPSMKEGVMVEPNGEKFVVKDSESGKIFGSYDTREEAAERKAEEELKMARNKADEVNEVEEPRAQGEKEFKAMHSVKVSGKKMDGSDIQEKKCEMSESEKQEKYQAFFKSALKRFGVESPAELEGDKKKEFFDYVDKNWKAEDEVSEAVTIKPANWKPIKGGISGEITNRLKADGYVYGKSSDMGSWEEPKWINPKTGVSVLVYKSGPGIAVAASSKAGSTILSPVNVSHIGDMDKLKKLFK